MNERGDDGAYEDGPVGARRIRLRSPEDGIK